MLKEKKSRHIGQEEGAFYWIPFLLKKGKASNGFTGEKKIENQKLKRQCN